MFVRYEINSAKDGTSYHFVTDSGNIYTAYFTEFILLNDEGIDIPVLSFGIACHLANEDKPQVRDLKIRNTVIHIIDKVFSLQPENAVLYICLDSDGRGKTRHATFERWFDHVENPIERYDAPEACEKNGYYSSMLIRPENPEKSKYISAFYFTISYYRLDEVGD